MEYDYGMRKNRTSPPPMYRYSGTSSSSSSQPPHVSSSFYPKIGQPGISPPPVCAPPSSGTGIRVQIKREYRITPPEYRIAPPPQLLPHVGAIPHSRFQFDFDFGKKVLAEAEKENQNWSRFALENVPSRTAEQVPPSSHGFDERDMLIQLPDDVLFSIMCRLTTKEAAQLSVLSHKWNKLWACYPGILNFEDSMIEYEARKVRNEVRGSKKIEALVRQDTCNFVRWITHVVEQHTGPSLEKFKVAFDLDNTYQSDIDKWVAFALLKGVSSLELECNANQIIHIERNFCSMPLKCCIALHNMPNRLKTLVLSHMEITAEVLECFLQSCPFLENLRLCNVSSLVSIRASQSLLALKHLDICDSELENIDISAPKLFTFKYQGCNIELNIRNASLLFELSIGCAKDYPSRSLQSFSEYFPQLEYLHLRFYKICKKIAIPPASNLTNLKHMRLTIDGYAYRSLLGLISLIEASPVLQKLTLESKGIFLRRRDYNGEMTFEKHTGPRPLKSLRKLEVYEFAGLQIEIEFVTYVIENAVALEEVFIDLKGLGGLIELNEKRAEVEFGEKLPSGAKLVINNRYQRHNFMHNFVPPELILDFYSTTVQGMWRRILKVIALLGCSDVFELSSPSAWARLETRLEVPRA